MKARQGNFWEETLARCFGYLLLMRYLGHTHAVSLVKNTGILFTYCTSENLYPQKLSIDTVSQKTRKFNSTKICTLMVCENLYHYKIFRYTVYVVLYPVLGLILCSCAQLACCFTLDGFPDLVDHVHNMVLCASSPWLYSRDRMLVCCVP